MWIYLQLINHRMSEMTLTKAPNERGPRRTIKYVEGLARRATQGNGIYVVRHSMFVGRKKEMARLEDLLHKSSASLVVVRGRRRIGKSRLIQEFGKTLPHYFEFSGLPPGPMTTAQTQRLEFAKQLARQVKIPGIRHDDWGDLFWHLANQAPKGRCLIFLDEITWMGSKDADFLGKLKNTWDQHFKKNPKLLLVLCGSVSGWIEKNILSSTGFLGRVSLDLELGELPLPECSGFWGTYEQRISSYEKCKILGVTGGVPRYLEEIRPSLSAEENIRQLCFQEGGVLVGEFDQIFSDLFTRRAPAYKEIVTALVKGSLERETLARKIRLEKGGVLSHYLEDLEKAGFISRDFTWHLKDGKESKLSRYRLSDNYIRFFLKYIRPNRQKIKTGRFDVPSLGSLPGWETIMGFQFENLVLRNRRHVQQLLRLGPADVISDNPYFQPRTARQEGCQIDYLIHSKFNTLHLCEIKFSRNVIDRQVLDQMRQKMKRLKIPKNFTIRPVLIYEGGLNPEIQESGFFDKIITFSDLLKAPAGED